VYRADGPFKLLEKVKNNAYKIDLSGEYDISCTINVADLKPYYEDDPGENLRANSFQYRENDVPIEDHDDCQSEELPKSKEIQDVLKVMRNELEDKVSYCLVISSIISNFLALVA